MSSATTVEPSTILEHRSPGITAIYNELKGSDRHRVLDLGNSSAATFAFFSQISCKIHFENLSEAISSQQSTTEQQIHFLSDYLTNFTADQTFDVILTWDIFNYLTLETITWFIRRIQPHCSPNALMHIVKYVGTAIPAHPRDFHIRAPHKITFIKSPLYERSVPSHGTAALLRNTPSFDMESSYLNYQGMVPNVAEQTMRLSSLKKGVARRRTSDGLAGIRSTSEQLNHGGQQHRSYALSDLIDKTTQRTNVHFLDLGLKNRVNSDFLFNQCQGVYTESLHEEFQLQAKKGQTPSLKSHMLNFPADLRFDVIFTWDIFNFMPLELIAQVLDRLQPHIHEQTLIYAILYSGKEIPCTPQKFSIVNSENLEIAPSSKKPNDSQLNATQLLKTLNQFCLANTYVFRPGMQRGIYEYLFQSQKQRG